jgi:hypothetical protein
VRTGFGATMRKKFDQPMPAFTAEQILRLSPSS